MSELHAVRALPVPYGVSIKWLWPEDSTWGNRLELQHLFSDDRLVKDFIPWPVTEKLIGGLKAGESLQIRLRLIDKDGNSREWLAGDWLEGTSSVDAEEYLSHTFLNEALIHPGSIQAAHIYAGHNLKPFSDERRMEAVAKVPEKIFGALAANYTFNREAATKPRLTDDMREAVLDAICESDLFQSLQAELNGQTASVDNLQQEMQQAATDAIRNALKPGGLLYASIKK